MVGEAGFKKALPEKPPSVTQKVKKLPPHVLRLLTHLFADWAKAIGTPKFGITAKDTGIDLAAKTRGTEEYQAMQCKCYDEHHRMMRRDTLNLPVQLICHLSHCCRSLSDLVRSPVCRSLQVI